jgi:hypothetical protein
MAEIRFLREQAAADQIRLLGDPYLSLLPYFEDGFSSVIDNGGDCYMEFMGAGESWFPLVINPGTSPATLAHSPYALHIRAAIIEIQKGSLPLPIRWLSAAGLGALGTLAGLDALDRCVFVNDWGHLPDLTRLDSLLKEDGWREALQERFPRHALLFKIPPHLDSRIGHLLDRAGIQRFPIRVVYYWCPRNLEQMSRIRRKSFRRDLRLIENLPFDTLTEKDDLSWVDPDEMRRLYRRIYIDKYYDLNMDLTTAGFEHILRTKNTLMSFFRQEGKLMGYTVLYKTPDCLYASLLGYRDHPDFPRSLYLPLVMAEFKQVMTYDAPLNLSAGCGEFKTNRGASRSIEYRYFYDRHLPLPQRLRWALIKLIYRLFTPFFFGRMMK